MTDDTKAAYLLFLYLLVVSAGTGWQLSNIALVLFDV